MQDSTRKLLKSPLRDLGLEVNFYLLLKKCQVVEVGDLGEVDWNDQGYLKSKGVKISATKMQILQKKLSDFLGKEVILGNN